MTHKKWKALRVCIVGVAACACGIGSAATTRLQERQQAASYQARTQSRVTLEVASFGDACARVAELLVNMKAKRVAVLDFYSFREPEWDRIGRQLASDLRVRLDSPPDAFQQTNYGEITKAMKRDGFWQEDLGPSEVAEYMLRGKKLDAYVIGSMTSTTERSSLDVRLYVHDVRTGGEPTVVTTSLPFTPDLKAMIEPSTPTPQKSTYRPGDKTTPPSCIYCAQAEYTEAARKAKIKGVVLLIRLIVWDEKRGRSQSRKAYRMD